jgi:hypothetical protein
VRRLRPRRHAITTIAPIAATPCGRSRRCTGANVIVHAATIERPIIGTYMKRSAIPCSPAWSSPITGAIVTTYQNHPTNSQG